MASNDLYQISNNKNSIQLDSINFNKFINNPSISTTILANTQFNKNNFGESSLKNLINESAHEDMKNEYETKEILNELRSKYLPKSVKKNSNFGFNNSSINNSQNMTYFNNNKNNSNLYFSTYTDYQKFPNSPNISTEKIDYYKYNQMLNLQAKQENSKLFQSSFLDNKDFTNTFTNFNFNDSIKFNKDNKDIIKNSNIQDLKLKKEDLIVENNNNLKNKSFNNINTSNNNIKEIEKSQEKSSYLNDYLTQENEKLKKINKNYELIVEPLIDYINDLNYWFRQDTLDKPNLNKVIKNNDLNNNHTPINELKSMLNLCKNNIINSSEKKNNNNIFKKNKSVNVEKNIYSNRMSADNRASTFNLKKKEFDINQYFEDVKPKIAEKKNESNEKNVLKNANIGVIKKARTYRQRIPKTYWSQNKRVYFIEDRK